MGKWGGGVMGEANIERPTSNFERRLFTAVHGKLGPCYNLRFQIADCRLKGGEGGEQKCSQRFHGIYIQKGPKSRLYIWERFQFQISGFPAAGGIPSVGGTDCGFGGIHRQDTKDAKRGLIRKPGRRERLYVAPAACRLTKTLDA